jgi:YD repeat-containing protein
LLGRVTGRTINGAANSLSLAYDAMGRVTTETNVLGTFTYGYAGTSGRLASVTYPNGQTSSYAYLSARQDHRLQTIHHQLPGPTTLSRFDYTYDAVGNIVTWQQQAGTAAPELWRYAYDEANQFIS